MRSRFILLPLAAVLVFAAVGDAEARAGKGVRSSWGGKSSSDYKDTPSPGGNAAYSPDSGGQRRSQSASSYRGGDYRLHLSGSRDSRPQTLSSAAPYRPQQTSAAAFSATAAVPVFTAPAPAPAPIAAAPAQAAKAAASETRVPAEKKMYRDPGAVNLCPAPYVFDASNGCRPKGAQVSSLR